MVSGHVGMEYAQMTSRYLDAIFCGEDMAVETKLEGIVVVGRVGDMTYRAECVFAVAVDDRSSGSVADFGRAFPVVNLEFRAVESEEVDGAGDAVASAEDGPLAAVWRQGTLGVESEKMTEAGLGKCFGFGAEPEVMFFDAPVEEGAELPCLFAFLSPTGFEGFGRAVGSRFACGPVVGIEFLEK